MSHTPLVLGSAQSPYPLRSGQVADRDDVRHAPAEQTADLATEADPASAGKRWPRYAAGAAIGSAAVAAALLYYNRSK